MRVGVLALLHHTVYYYLSGEEREGAGKNPRRVDRRRPEMLLFFRLESMRAPATSGAEARFLPVVRCVARVITGAENGEAGLVSE